uniref:Uncharacterized protein n=1 Tax=Anguilla anguilla TaxID=7936 RepID=A0A0E9UGV0_ANGAN
MTLTFFVSREVIPRQCWGVADLNVKRNGATS